MLPRYFNTTIPAIPTLNHEYPNYHEIVDYYDINWVELAKACEYAVRFQDNIIDYTPYFLKENEELQMRERRVGIGTMGLGTLMVQMRLRYGSDAGNKFLDTLYKFIAYHTYKASIMLAKEKCAFPAYQYDMYIQSGFAQRIYNEFPDLHDLLKQYGIRNVTLLTEAPTGSTATYIDNIPQFVNEFGGTSTGIEPYFAFQFWRASRLGEGFMQTMAIADKYMKEYGIDSIDNLPEWFVTAMDLEPIDHVKVQAVVQRWTDSSISKTANCPNEYTVEQVEELYMSGYDMGCKGLTIYRSGSREAQVLSTDKDGAKLESHIEVDKLEELKKATEESYDEFLQRTEDVMKQHFNDLHEQVEELLTEGDPHVPIVKRPSRLYGFTEKIRFSSGEKLSKAYVTINVDDEGTPIELFIVINDPALQEFGDSIGRLTTQMLRFGKTTNNVDQVVKHLRAGKSMGSLSAKVASLLEQTAYGKIKVPMARKPKSKKNENVFHKCSECGEMAYDKANCICTACGYSKCN